MLVNFDKRWCGNYQVPASLLLGISGKSSLANKLARLRFFLAISLAAELAGYFLITLGLLAHRPLWIFLTGVILKTTGELLGASLQNKAGAFLSIELQKYLKKASSNLTEIRSILAQKGCSESEINSIQSLSSEVYQSELNGYQKSRILNLGIPLACGFALLINNDLITAFIVIALGLLAFPIGERFFKEHTFRKESELRLGQAAQLLPYIEKVYEGHVQLTVKVNFLSQLPLLFFAFRFLMNGSGQLLSSFFGLTQGLIGLTGTLAFQKSRAAALRTTTTAYHLIDALSNPYIIVTANRWEEHCSTTKASPSQLSKLQNGIIFENFRPHIPLQHEAIFSISSTIPYGSLGLLRAPSGTGKSTFLAAVMHLIDHSGDLFFVEEGHCINVHTLSRDAFDKKIFFFREDNVDKSARLLDLFKTVTFKALEDILIKAKTLYNPLLVELAWNTPDNLIEMEIKNLETDKPAVFPKEMLSFLKDLRVEQIKNVKGFLEKSRGNLSISRIYPERFFSTLSSGEKRRLTTLIAYETSRVLKEISLVILDEPLTHLDAHNIQHQMQIIREIQELPHAPAILLISHHFIAEIKEQLLNAQEIGLNDYV